MASSNTHGDGIEQLKTTRRRFLQGSGGAMAGFGAFNGDDWVGSSIEAVDDELGHIDGNYNSFAKEATPLDVDPATYVMKHGHRKRRAMEVVLSHPDVNDVVGDYYGSFDAFDDWLDHDAIGFNGCRDFSVEEGGRAGLEQGEHTVKTEGNQYVRALVDREGKDLREDRVSHLSITEPQGYTIKRRYGEAERRILQSTLEKEPVQELLADADEWYVGIGKVTSISSYSPKYQKAEITFPVFILPREHDYLAVDTGIEVKNWPDNPEAGELVYAQAIHPKDAEGVEENQYGVKAKGRVMDPPQHMAKKVKVDDSYASVDAMPDPPAEKVPWLFRGSGHYSPKVKAETPNPTQQNNWNVEWSDSSTDGMIHTASYDGTQVFERMALSVSLTAYPPHNGKYSEDIFVGPRSRADGNVMFHDNLGLTGPGVLGKMDLPTIDRDWAPSDRPEGFKFRSHYHTGAVAVPEFHSGLRFGPYNYVIDWHFFEDGQMVGTYQRNGPGYETGHGIPIYASMWSFVPTPGGAEESTVHWFDGSWNQVTEESKMISDGSNMLRVKDPGSDEVIDFNLSQEDEVYVLRYHDDEMGVAPRVKNSDKEKQFWHPTQYMNGESVDNERVVVWVIQTTHGEEVPYKSGSVPFINTVKFDVTTADGMSGGSQENLQAHQEAGESDSIDSSESDGGSNGGGSDGGSSGSDTGTTSGSSGGSSGGDDGTSGQGPGLGLLTGAAGALGAGAWFKRQGGDSE